MLFLLSCAGLQSAAPTSSGARVYSVSVASSFDTVGTDADGAPLGALEDLAHQDLHLRGTVVMTRSRTFRDDSIGWRVVFDELDEGPSADGPWRESGLEGRSVELRTFDDGQILAISDAAHWTGAPRHGEVFDLLLPTLSPTVPVVSEGDTAFRRSSWPFQVSSKSGLRSTLVAEYTSNGTRSESGSRRVELDYAGKLEAEGHDSRLDGELAMDGQVTGTVWMRPSDAVMVRHDATWERKVVASYASGATITQDQHFQVAATLVDDP